jgi:hypothetical protein
VNLGNCLAVAGGLQEAEQLDRQTYQTYASRLGETHPDALVAGLNLADDLSRLGRTDEADRLRGRLLPLLTERLGTDHPTVARVQSGERVDRELEPQPT